MVFNDCSLAELITSEEFAEVELVQAGVWLVTSEELAKVELVQTAAWYASVSLVTTVEAS